LPFCFHTISTWRLLEEAGAWCIVFCSLWYECMGTWGWRLHGC
jgi:hypothetical protein